MTESTERLSSALADRYQILSRLGEGGMATVYLAEDLKHDRKVAVKVLRPELAAVLGADRFVQEIKTTANLQHPHILPLFDSGEADTFLYYVMPFIDGETLRAKLDRETQLGIDEAVTIAANVADALDYAHRHGIIHRDIKPENILLHDGRPMVADFGIALAVSAAAGGRMTETGLSLGTPHYMSPEQATAEKEITARSDVYSLGSVLYEMLTGEPPHLGNSAQQIIMKIIADDVRPVTELRKSVPPNVADAVAKSLEKLPADRFESAAAFARALEDEGFTIRQVSAVTPRTATGSRASWLTLAAVAVLLLLLGAFMGSRLVTEHASERQTIRFHIPFSDETRLNLRLGRPLALTGDGRTIIYDGFASGTATNVFYRRDLGELISLPIPGSEGGSFPSSVPNTSRIAYQRNSPEGRELVQIPLEGGGPTAVGKYRGSFFLWLDEHSWVWTREGNLLRYAQGEQTVIAKPDREMGENTLIASSLLPGGRVALVIAGSSFGVPGGPVYAVSLETGERTPILEAASGVWYADGCIAWTVGNGTLFGARFDPGRLTLDGPAVPLATDVGNSSGSLVAVSEGGSLVYAPPVKRNLVLLDRQGNREIVGPERRFHNPRFSSDGRRLAMDLLDLGERDAWVLDLQQRTLSRVTSAGDGRFEAWMPDDETILTHHGDGIWRSRSDGTGAADSLGIDLDIADIAADGSMAVAVGDGPGRGSNSDIAILSLADPEDPRWVLASPYNEAYPSLSPDGRWLAYSSDETGREEIYVIPWPDGGGRVLVSREGGVEPRWAPDGTGLYYISQRDERRSLVMAEVVTSPGFAVQQRIHLFDVTEFTRDNHFNWDVSPDGTRFVMVQPGSPDHLVYILNWSEEVRRRSRE